MPESTTSLNDQTLGRRNGTILLLTTIAAGALLALWRGQDATIDLSAYHAVDAFWLLANHLRDVEPAGYQSYFNPLLSLPTYLGLQTLSPRSLAMVIGAEQALIAPCLYLISRRLLLGRSVSVAVAAAGMLTGSALSEYGTSQGDLTLAPLILFGVWLAMRSVTAESRVHDAAFAGVALGAAAGMKWAVAPYAIVALPVAVRSAARAARVAGTMAAGVLAGAVVTYGWWGAVLWSRYGDPFFPALGWLFHSSYLANGSSIGPGRALTNPLQDLLFPWRMNLSPLSSSPRSFRQLTVPAVEVVLVVLVTAALVMGLSRRHRVTVFAHASVRYLAVLVCVSWVLLCSTTATYRYDVALELLCYPLLVALVVQLAALVDHPKVALPAAALLVVALLVTQVPPQWGTSPFTAHYFSVHLPAAVRRPGTNLVVIDDALNGFVITTLPASDVVVRDGLVSPVSRAMLELERRSLRRGGASYVVWGDPTEVGEPAWAVDPVVDTTLHALGLSSVSPAACVTGSARAPNLSFPLYACRVGFVESRHG